MALDSHTLYQLLPPSLSWVMSIAQMWRMLLVPSLETQELTVPTHADPVAAHATHGDGFIGQQLQLLCLKSFSDQRNSLGLPKGQESTSSKEQPPNNAC